MKEGRRNLDDAVALLPEGTWPTPRAVDGDHGGAAEWELARDAHKDMLHVRLARHPELWATPTTQDAKNDAGPSQFERNSRPLNVMAAVYPEGSSTTSPRDPVPPSGASGSTLTPRLNPEFVEILMGFEVGWTKIDENG